MEPNKPTLEEDAAALMADLPTPIRSFFASGQIGPITKQIVEKNHLRIDQGGVLQNGIILLLAGLSDPITFAQTLEEDGDIDETGVNAILQDVNEQIFMPLQQKMREGGGGAKPVIPAPRPQVDVPRYQPPPRPPMPARPETLARGGPPPNLPGQMRSDRALPDHEVGHINVPAPSAPPKPPVTLPKPPLNTPLRGASGDRPAEQDDLAPIPLQKYGVDPYRESFNEN